jgi:hypothetical protein
MGGPDWTLQQYVSVCLFYFVPEHRSCYGIRADAGFPSEKAVVLEDKIKGTLCVQIKSKQIGYMGASSMNLAQSTDQR